MALFSDFASSCDECLRLHGAKPLNPAGEGLYNFIPTGFVQDLSSAYCAQKTASRGWSDFAGNFSVTHPVSYGTVTGGTDLLKGKTAVNNYFTETSGEAQSTGTATGSIQRGGSIETTQSSSSISQASRTAAVTAASSTGAADCLRSPRLFGIGLLGIMWFL